MRRFLILICVLTVAACGKDRDITLKDLRSFSGGPDEFLVLPTKPLVAPTNFTDLPAPTPGGKNLTDPNPMGDAVAALGGQPQRLEDTGVPGADAALVNYANRAGSTGDIRQTLAAEDQDFRSRKARFTKIRLVRVDRYNEAYRSQSLRPYDELERWRKAGAPTPSAPPGLR
ncbi:MAG TPA: DUF3035 domain-containing protein [Rhodobacteraceae bacterium]|jgi:hypothetical protein|nr:DUF3035 domain-containing protein [Paracoccaceae bacterium]